jgi:RNA polymerase sigma factor (sigma-70 family)
MSERGTAVPAAMTATAPHAAERDRRWDDFVARHSALLLRVARFVTHDHDAAMDAYAFVLGQLREDDARRLAAYRAEAGCTFETWLAVVARRLCLDHHRQKYGRPRGESAESHEAQQERRRLVDLVSVELETEIAASDPGADADLDRRQLLSALNLTLEELPPSDRLLLRYRFEDGLSAARIAPVMKFRSVFHVYRRINVILTLCRERLRRMGVESSEG